MRTESSQNCRSADAEAWCKRALTQYLLWRGSFSMSLPLLRFQVIAAEGEHKASRALKDASDVINESPSALQLRYLQTLNTISAEKNSTIIFPLPIEFLSTFIQNKAKSS